MRPRLACLVLAAAAFDLRAFHDEVLSYGSGAPISAIRRAGL